MTTTTRNKAAERLLDWFPGTSEEGKRNFQWRVNEALAAERRATVERIRERLATVEYGDGDGYDIDETNAILDEEAAR